jgi:predicted short-subunit dehydrogenase-like oxidoreductase (DUF2520 family)
VVSSARRAAYHASASLAANALTALMDAAFEVAVRGARLSPADARQGLIRLAEQALIGLRRHAPRHAITGPIARGDLDTVRRHLDVLRRLHPDLLPLYRALALRTIRIARAGGRLPPAAAGRLGKMMRPGIR